jgi:chemotaxis protein methyltransferase CheR
MTLGRPALASIRRALEATFGLALEGLAPDQIAGAVAAASGDGALVDAGDPAFLRAVVDRLPIDESWLFRDEGLWAWLAEEAGAALLARAQGRHRALRVLSLGCSSGQEVFSLAILFQGLLEAQGLPPSAAASFVEVHGIDSSPGRIEQARSGLVSSWSVQRCGAGWLRGRVAPEPGAAGRFRVAPSVLSMCRFEVGNLLEVAGAGSAALGGWDLVLCRHVLIYARPERAAAIVAAMGEGLDPGAMLVVGATEAHLLGGVPSLVPLPHLGAARAANPSERERRARATEPPRTARRARPAVAGSGSGRLPRAQGSAGGAATAEAHLRRALEHAAAGRGAEALREARAAFFLEPKQLMSRLLLARALLSHDRDRGREVLKETLEQASRLSPEAEVPFAPGLSVAQVAAAARLLLDGLEGS